MSLLSRFTERLGAATAATLGSQRAKGQLERLDTVSHLRREWARFLGHRGGPPTLGAMCDFLSGYGVDLSEAHSSSTARMSAEQQERTLSEAALAMIRAGTVDFNPGSNSQPF